MTERRETNSNNSLELGKKALREAVLEDGGLQGLFMLARMPESAELLFAKYDPLLKAAVSPKEKEERKRKYMSDERKDPVLNPTDKKYMEIASIEGLNPDDVPAMLFAVSIYGTAFPSKSPDEKTKE